MVTGTNYLYHSLDLLAPEIKQHLYLSIDSLESTKVKFFQGVKRTAMFLLTEKNNMACLLDQEDLQESIISAAVRSELGIEEIVDFTMLNFSLLVLLLANGSLVIFDCALLFGSNWQSSSLLYMQTVEAPQDS